MKFLRWIVVTALVSPLIMLFLWNVIVTTMFASTIKTTFGVCFWISVVINVIYAGVQIVDEWDFDDYRY